MRPLTKVLGIGSILIAVFGVSFFIFYPRAQKDLPKQPLILTSSVINQPLPKANLVNVSGKPLDDEKLRRGKVVLVFTLTDCKPCDEENEFLKTVVESRKDVRFIYVIPFGNKDQALKAAQSKYAFETFFDDGSMLSRSLQVYQVPLKVFLEDGIIKKTWVDATFDSQGQAEFKDWLNGL
jgi:thiol-disulfide isomerase/thioredoxin